MRTPAFSLIVGMALGLTGLAAHAQSVNLTTLTAYGDVSANTTSASLTTAAIESGETPSSGSSAWFYTELEPALLPGGTTLGADTFEGSALAYEFTLSAPGTLSFNWSLSTAETLETDPASGLSLLDRSFVSFDGAVSTLATASLTPQNGSYLSGVLGAGTHRFSVGVMDVNDVLGVSTLGVSNLSVSVSAVPEPETYALLIGGLAVIGARLRRRNP